MLWEILGITRQDIEKMTQIEYYKAIMLAEEVSYYRQDEMKKSQRGVRNARR